MALEKPTLSTFSADQVTPECVQLQRNTEGKLNGDALITFLSRGEAERAIVERNRRHLGNRFIELFMA